MEVAEADDDSFFIPLTMLSFDFQEVLGILFSILASIIIGAFWYSPLMFGPAWMRGVGLTEQKIQSMSTTPAQAIIIAIMLGALFALLMNILFTWIGVRTIAQGSVLAMLCCMTFYVAPALVHAVFEDSSKRVWLIYTSHELLLSLCIGAIISWSILN